MNFRILWYWAVSLFLAGAVTASPPHWKHLAEGISVTGIDIPHAQGKQIHVLRFHPDSFKLDLLMASESGNGNQTADVWAKDNGMICTFNAGMFAQDYISNVGFMKHGEHINNAKTNKYQSIAAWDPIHKGDPVFQIFDLDTTPMAEVKNRYRTVIQNLRLIKAPGENRWKQSDRRWSEIALASDTAHHLLLCYSGYPLTMHDFNKLLLNAGLGITHAQHLEGGPEASLWLSLPDTTIRWMGVYETGFYESNNNIHFWAIPNVIAIGQRNKNSEK
jgi:hypothetical protein